MAVDCALPVADCALLVADCAAPAVDRALLVADCAGQTPSFFFTSLIDGFVAVVPSE